MHKDYCQPISATAHTDVSLYGNVGKWTLYDLPPGSFIKSCGDASSLLFTVESIMIYGDLRFDKLHIVMNYQQRWPYAHDSNCNLRDFIKFYRR